MDRRTFLKSTGALSFAIAFAGDGLQLIAPAHAATAQKINAWVSIAPDGTVTILSAGAEMGQGSMTSLPIIVAEEMDADWSKVKIEFAPADAEVYGYTFQNAKGMAIVGSRAVMLYFNQLRTAGAQVRKVLVANAAQKWGVDAASLKTEPGFVVDGSGRRMSYGEIASFATVPSALPAVAASASATSLRLVRRFGLAPFSSSIRTASGRPVTSTATSGPLPPVSSRTRCRRASGVGCLFVSIV